jgi:hypothetical protein
LRSTVKTVKSLQAAKNALASQDLPALERAADSLKGHEEESLDESRTAQSASELEAALLTA